MQKSIIFAATAIFAARAATGGLEPNAGTWHTWVITDVRSYRVPVPPDLTASEQEALTLETLATQSNPAARFAIDYWNAGSPAYRWIQVAQQEVDSRGLGGPAATRAMSLVAAGLNDAIIAAWDSKYVYGRARPSRIDRHIRPAIPVPNSPSYPSDYAAAAAVSAAVLDYLFPDDQSRIDSLAQTAAQSRVFAGVEFPTDAAAGMALGKAVGDAVIARARADGSGAPFTGSFPPAPGTWTSATPSFPLAGTWMPWALTSGSQFRPAAPSAFGSVDFQAQVDAVRQLARTPDISHTAWFWQPSFIDPWIDLATRYLFESGVAHDAPRAAQTYALVLVAQHDATIACWDTKYTYLEMRPVMADPAIVTLFPTPAHPSFPSGHACASGAAAAVMSAVFPNATSDFQSRAREAGLSTFYAGIHYPNDVDRGLTLGAAVARVVLAQAAPEVNLNE